MTEKYEKILTDRQKKALPFFVGSRNHEEGCRKAGVSKHAFYTWLQNPAFKAELHRLQNEVVADAVQTLKFNVTHAADVLVSLLDNKANPSIQRAVCNDIIGHISKFREIEEIERRLEILESNAKTNLGG